MQAIPFIEGRSAVAKTCMLSFATQIGAVRNALVGTGSKFAVDHLERCMLMLPFERTLAMSPSGPMPSTGGEGDVRQTPFGNDPYGSWAGRSI